MYRKVYLDFQDSYGYRDISSLVKYDTLSITLQAFSDNFHFAQNEASFDIIYDSVIYPLLRYATKDIICKIVDVYDESLITAENDYFLTTENGFYLAREVGGFVPWFYGRISPVKSRSYNGILNNTIWTVQAEDDSRQLDKAVGDICYTNFTIMNPSDPSTSIVHQLAYIAGFTLSQIGNVTISTSISKFAPNSEEDSILNILDTLLFEYGYVLNFDVNGKLTPIKWINEDAVEYNFTEYNMCREVTVEDSVKDYYGARLTWYELSQAVTASGNRNILLYMDDNCPYENGTGWAGYSIPNGYTYPPQTNVIDPTTSGNTVVYQEYTEGATSYWTNYAIVNKLEYNYSAFDSDFSAIVATSGQWVDWSGETGIVMTVSGFGNKKARIVYSNPTAAYKKLYYNNIYGQVWYKSAERTLTVDNTTVSGQKLDEYVSNWIFDSTTASGLVTYLAAQHNVGNTYYNIISEDDAEVGAVANVTMGDGTNQDCLIMSKSWNEGEQIYTYKLRARSVDRGVLTSQGYKTASKLEDQEAIVSEIYPAYVSVGANIDGSSPDLTNAYTDMYIYRGGKDVTYDWTYSATPTGVTGSFGTGGLANRYTVNGFSSNATKHGSVLITASRAGYTPQSFNFIIDKICQSDAVTTSGVAALTSHYYGKYLNTTPSGSFVTGDTYCRYSATSGAANRGVFVYSGGWVRTEENKYVNTALTDISFLIAYTNASGVHIYGTAADYTSDSVVQANFAFFQSAMIGYLEANNIKLTASGSIYGGDRYNANGTDNNTSASGFWMGSNGIFKSDKGSITSATISGVNGYFGNVRIGANGSLVGGDRYDKDGTIIDRTVPGFFIGASGACKVAGMQFSGSIDTDGLSGVSLSSPFGIGSTFSLSTIAYPSLAALDESYIVYSEPAELRLFAWSGSTFAQIGTTTTSVTGIRRIIRLSNTTLALIHDSTSNATIEVYSVSLTTGVFTKVGNTYSTGKSGSVIGLVDASHIVFYNATNNVLNVLAWDGSDFSLTCTSNALSHAPGSRDIIAISPGRIIFNESSTSKVACYYFDGSTIIFEARSSMFITGGTAEGLAALNNTDFVIMASSGLIFTIVRYIDGEFSIVNRQYNNSIGAEWTAITALSGASFMVASSYSGRKYLAAYSMVMALSKPYQP